MSILTSLAQILRPTSKPEGVFVVRQGWDVARILQEAEDWGPSVVIFMPGDFDLRETFEFRNVSAILGHGIGVTRLRRFGQQLFRSVWPYANIDHAPVISGFSIENVWGMDSRWFYQDAAIELGSQQNIRVSDIYSHGVPADLLCFTNSTPDDPPPPGRPFGTWTENITLERIVVYSPKSAAIRFRVTDPNKRGQSFSYLRLAAQITCTVPGSIAVDFESHCHAYGAVIHAKINMDAPKAITDPPKIGINVGPECNITACDLAASFIEGVPLIDPDTIPNVVPAGYRIRVASSARVSGHGKFYRQRESHTPDDITPGVNWAGEPAGTVKGDILAEEGI